MESEQGEVVLRVVPVDRDNPVLLQGMVGFPELSGAEVLGFAEANDGLFMLAYVRGQPAGCGGYRRLTGADETVVEFASMYVRPGAQRAGLARTILGELERCAVDDGYTSGVARVPRGAQAVRALLEVSGYRVESSAPDAPDGQLVYGKALTVEDGPVMAAAPDGVGRHRR
ncbi:GNAT family N-acetyltransferase [Pseudonocardia spinosispora]|uniref:GNAT family N-acetyltransferase n=1 Tax=Pseudonocardia spinosispora TaxID=103441 RepID=UPI0003FF6F3D|nr:GNAT family N-acetyltransferase [Pseudonocardia spinosispora]